MTFSKKIRAPRSLAQIARGAAMAALLVPTVACTSGPQIDPQLELSAATTERLEPMAVTGLGGKKLIWLDRIQYGPYRVEDVDRGWTRSKRTFFTIGGKRWNLVFRDWKPFAIEGPHWSWQFGAWDGRPDWVSDYAFDLSENGEPAWEGQCGVELMSAYRESMSCALRRLSDDKVWILALADVDAVPAADWLPPFVAHHKMAGYLADEETSLQVIENIGRPQGIPVSLEMGYSITHEGQTLAALDQLSDPAKMWLPRQDEEMKGVLAAGSAALYLYRDLRDDVDKRIQRRLSRRF